MLSMQEITELKAHELLIHLIYIDNNMVYEEKDDKFENRELIDSLKKFLDL